MANFVETTPMRLLLLLFISNIWALSGLQAQTYFPPDHGQGVWDSITPSSLGICEDSVAALYNYLETEQSKSFMLIKDGKIVLEKYFGTYTADSLWVWFSAGKSLRAMLIGIAQEEGLLNILDKSSDYLGNGWTSLTPAQEDSITIWHQLTMTSGLDEQEFYCTDPSCLKYLAPAGTRWAYHNGPYSLLRDVLENASGKTINNLTTTRIKTPTGMSGGFWLKVGENTFYFSTARDMARYGLLVLNNGVWNNDTILGDTAYFRQMTTSSQDINPSYGYLWWLNGKASYIPPEIVVSVAGSLSPNAPEDGIIAAGAQGQFIVVVPSQQLVMIRQGWFSENHFTAITLMDGIWQRLSDLNCTNGIADLATTARIFPNPTNGRFTVEGFPELASIELIDARGQVFSLRSQDGSFDVSNLSSGIYHLLIMENERRMQSARLVIP